MPCQTPVAIVPNFVIAPAPPVQSFKPSGVTALAASLPVFVSAIVANSTIPAFESLAVSPVIVIVVLLELVSIPAPPAIVKSTLPAVSLTVFSSSVAIVTPVISPASISLATSAPVLYIILLLESIPKNLHLLKLLGYNLG